MFVASPVFCALRSCYAIHKVLLRFGILTSRQAPTDLHPYGYLKDKFLWSLVSAVGIFCLGAGVTVAHGVMTLGAPPAEMQYLGWNAAGAWPCCQTGFPCWLLSCSTWMSC